ncbi:MAG TPA: 3-methyladenine DNA glycosylase [Phycisphaerales bacterium]|nr:3-methyladenine DNA glycosylase [Phycisphaerales bacterium]
MTPAPRWTDSDFLSPSESLAPALLGQVLVRILPDGTRLSGRIVEAEAYLGPQDLASHAAGGRRTHRNRHMYDGPGTSYVYFTYGMHHCFNIVCGARGHPLAVLIRALEPLEGVDRMRALRAAGSARVIADTDLLRGPGRLCQGMGISLDDSGLDLGSDRSIWVERVERVELGERAERAERAERVEWASGVGERVGVGPRIGIGGSHAWVEAPLRWFVEGSPFVSHRRAPVGARRAGGSEHAQVARGG